MSGPIYPIESPRMQAALIAAVARIPDCCIRLDNGCLIWTRSTNGKGYGEIRILNKKFYVHRLVLWNKLGRDNSILTETTLDTMHSCDDRLCCEEQHISAGTRSDNLKDAADKGRMIVPEPARKLDHGDVETIRRLSLEGHSNREIGKLYDMNPGNVSRIIRGVHYAS